MANMNNEKRMIIKYAAAIRDYCSETNCGDCKLTTNAIHCPFEVISYLNKNEQLEDPEIRMLIKYAIAIDKICKDQESCVGCIFDTPVHCIIDRFPNTWDLENIKEDTEND